MATRFGFCSRFAFVIALSACASATDPTAPAGEGAAARSPVVDLDAPLVGENADSEFGDGFANANGEALGVGLLVWTKTEEGATETVQLDEATGRELGRESGIHIAASGKTWRAHFETRKHVLPTCKAIFAAQGVDSDFEEEAAEEGETTRLTFVGDDGAQTLIDFDDAKDMTDSYAGFQSSVEITGSIGPYVFVKRTTYAYACGAHGSTAAEAFVWDLERRQWVDLAAEIEVDAAMLAEARAELGDDVFDFDEPPQMTELVPRIDEDARIAIDRQITMAACYACSDGRWSSYSRSAVIARPSLPRSLEPHVAVSPAILTFRSEHPDRAIGGFSNVR